MNQLCIKQGALGCEQFIYADPTMDGGGPFFIEEFLSTKSILNKFNATDSIMEMCCGLGAMGYYLAKKLNLNKIEFVDIDPDAATGINYNKEFLDIETNFHLSSAFTKYKGGQVDLIILNPPHVTLESEFKQIAEETPEWFPSNSAKQANRSRLILIDKDFADWFERFCQSNDVYLVTGSDRPKTLEQIGESIYNTCKRVYNSKIEAELGDNFSYDFIQNSDIEGYYLLIATKKD